MNRRLPVTLVGGFLGAGKTSLLHDFISGHAGGYLAVLVESPGEPNVDARALRGLCGAMRRGHDEVLEIPRLEESAQLDWLAETFREFSQSGRFERVLIETSGTMNAARLGPAFAPGGRLAAWAELHQIVCLVDALDFYRSIAGPMPQNTTPVLDLQRAQVEGASLLVLNKCDLVEQAARDACLKKLCEWNPDAPLVETAYGELSAEVWGRAARPERQLRAETKPGESAGWSSTLFRAYRPFHPARFWDWFQADHPGLLRTKGIVWLATRNLLVGGVSRTRWQSGCGSAGVWWAALPREEWPQDDEILARMQETWREPYGDRRQELVLLGEASRMPAVTQRLQECLLSDAEYARPVKEWTSFPDPFPAWDVEG
jgi:G3E family GTPase